MCIAKIFADKEHLNRTYPVFYFLPKRTFIKGLPYARHWLHVKQGEENNAKKDQAHP